MSALEILVIVFICLFLFGGGYGHLSGAAWAGSYGNGGLIIGVLLIVALIFMLRGRSL